MATFTSNITSNKLNLRHLVFALLTLVPLASHGGEPGNDPDKKPNIKKNIIHLYTFTCYQYCYIEQPTFVLKDYVASEWGGVEFFRRNSCADIETAIIADGKGRVDFTEIFIKWGGLPSQYVWFEHFPDTYSQPLWAWIGLPALRTLTGNFTNKIKWAVLGDLTIPLRDLDFVPDTLTLKNFTMAHDEDDGLLLGGRDCKQAFDKKKGGHYMNCISEDKRFNVAIHPHFEYMGVDRAPTLEITSGNNVRMTSGCPPDGH